jgi:hypothetical protein
VVEGVGKLDEVAVVAVDSQLDLAENVPVLDVDEDIVGSFIESVDNPHKLHVTFLQLALP